MIQNHLLTNSDSFSAALFNIMAQINRGIAELELYEFRYALDNLLPVQGWHSVTPIPPSALMDRINKRSFFESIELKPFINEKIGLDGTIQNITQMLFVGLVKGDYQIDWVKDLFYFDIRGFFFLVRTQYMDQISLTHFGNHPFMQFTPDQQHLETRQEIGYKEFQQANQAIDRAFIQIINKLISINDFPLLITLVGPSGAGKTEIVLKLQESLTLEGKSTTNIEMDNFYKDRSFRDGKPLDKEVIHFNLFLKSIKEITERKKTLIPKYDFYLATSSHDLDGCLKSGQTMLEIEPADIIFLEGNFPFHIPEIAPLIGIKIVYLTDDPIRLKRKWKRDIDLRKKYDPFYLCNRFFRTQFLRAEEVYRPMMAISDIFIDTSAASLWVKPELISLIGSI